MIRITYFICWLTIRTASAFGQEETKNEILTLGNNPVFVVDSQRIAKSDLSKYKPDSIALVFVMYDTSAMKIYGKDGKDGAVVIETRSFARRKFVSFLRNSSRQYDSLYSILGNDTSFVYILNNKVQSGNYEGNLSSINEDLFINLTVLTKDQLEIQYNIKGKEYGISIRSTRPKNLSSGDNNL